MDPLFQVHRLNNEGHARAGSVQKAFNELLAKLREKVPPGRELAICEMHLEIACVYAKKQISNVPELRYVPQSRRFLKSQASATSASAPCNGSAVKKNGRKSS